MQPDTSRGYLPNSSLIIRFPNADAEDGGVWVWRPLMNPGDGGNADLLIALRREGFQPFDSEGTDSYTEGDTAKSLAIWGQFGRLLPLEIPGRKHAQRWVHTSDQEHATAVPVALAFNLPEQIRAAIGPDAETLPAMPMLPPPQWGEWGLIPEAAPDLPPKAGRYAMRLVRYHVQLLGEEGMALREQMQDAIVALAAPAEWWLITPELYACLDGQYTAYRHALHKAQMAAISRKERERIQAQIEVLELAAKHHEALKAMNARHGRDRAALEADMGEIRQMAQQLAALYWQYHQRELARNATAEQAAQVQHIEHASTGAVAQIQVHKTHVASGMIADIEVSAKPAAKPPARRQHSPRAALVVRDPATIQVKSDIFTQGIIRALRDGDAYTQYPDRRMAEYSSSLAKRKGDITITLTPGDGENWEQVLTWLNSLGDEVVDTFIAVLALATDENGVDSITEPFWHSPDDGLAVCQRKKSNRAYTPEQRAAWIENLRILSRMHIRAEWPGKRRGRTSYISSALIDVLGQGAGEYKTITGETIWERRQVKVGEWAHLMGTPYDTQMAVTFRKILSYHAQRDRYAKRLGLYLNLQFRVNVKQPGGAVERTMATLIEQAGIKPDLKHPGDTRRGIEDALYKLRKDGVIGTYTEVVDSSPSPSDLERRARIEQRAYGWWDDYTATLWRIEPPNAIRQQYRRLAVPGDVGDDSK